MRASGTVGALLVMLVASCGDDVAGPHAMNAGSGGETAESGASGSGGVGDEPATGTGGDADLLFGPPPLDSDAAIAQLCAAPGSSSAESEYCFSQEELRNGVGYPQIPHEFDAGPSAGCLAPDELTWDPRGLSESVCKLVPVCGSSVVRADASDTCCYRLVRMCGV
jgi:hypothetical protein